MKLFDSQQKNTCTSKYFYTNYKYTLKYTLKQACKLFIIIPVLLLLYFIATCAEIHTILGNPGSYITISSPATLAESTEETDYFFYTVAAGDSLWLISSKFNTTVSEIVSLNNLKSTTIYPGQLLKIPLDKEPGIKNINYTVRMGDTLSRLAEYFGTSIENIKILNMLFSDIIYIGQILKIPASCVKHRVVPGDTLWKLSQKYNTTIGKIMLFNSLNEHLIYINQILYIPSLPQVPEKSYITYTVQPGDTVWSISIKYGIPNYEILNANGMSESSILTVGQKLKIPVYKIPVKPTPGPQYGEYLDWWTEAQYLFPIGKTAVVRDFITGTTFNIKRTIGANHADCEPLSSADSNIIKTLWGGRYSWVTRAIIVEVDNRKIAASMSSMPHDISYIENNNFDGHFDIHFRNSTRHSDGAVDHAHQEKVKIAAGVKY